MMKDKADVCLARGILVLSAAVLLAGIGLIAAGRGAGQPAGTAPVGAFVWSGRDAMRREELDRLQALAQDESAPEALRTAAGERLLDVMARMESERAIERVLTERGYERVTATVQAGSVNVVVGGGRLEADQAGIILELAARESGVPAENIKIIPAG